MKAWIIALTCLLGIANVLCNKTIAQTSPDESSQSSSSKKFFFGLGFLVAIPQSSLKEYSKVRGGVWLELGIPIKANPSWGVGIEFSGILSAEQQDTLKGLAVGTGTTLIEIHPFIRWSPNKELNLKPFFDFSIGIMSAVTETTSEIVDEATFLDQLLFGNQTTVETTTHQSNSSSNLSYTVGAGVIIKKVVRVGIRYQHANPLNYIDQNEVYVTGGSIQYPVHYIPLDMIVVTFGLVF